MVVLSETVGAIRVEPKSMLRAHVGMLATNLKMDESTGRIWNGVNILKALQPYYVFFFRFVCRGIIDVQIDFQGVGEAIEHALLEC